MILSQVREQNQEEDVNWKGKKKKTQHIDLNIKSLQLNKHGSKMTLHI